MMQKHSKNIFNSGLVDKRVWGTHIAPSRNNKETDEDHEHEEERKDALAHNTTIFCQRHHVSTSTAKPAPAR